MEQNASKNNIFFSEYVLKKVEKISNALYIITSYFPEDEPLRLSIRKKIIKVLSDISVLRTSKNQGNIKIVANVSDHISELVALLSVARTAGLVSVMNYEILEQELGSLASLGGNSTGPVFESSYFDSGLLPSREQLTSTHKTSTPPVSSKSLSGEQTPKKQEKRERKQHILEILQGSGSLTIKDIARHIPGYSNKTIQRELNTLIDRGVVVKEGERRWSRYSLAE